MTGRPVLTIDPQRRAGEVCVEGRLIPAAWPATRVVGGDTVDGTAAFFKLTRQQVLVCCWWWQQECTRSRRKHARQVAAAWAEWANTASLVLGGHAYGPLSDPPPVTP